MPIIAIECVHISLQMFQFHKSCLSHQEARLNRCIHMLTPLLLRQKVLIKQIIHIKNVYNFWNQNEFICCVFCVWLLARMRLLVTPYTITHCCHMCECVQIEQQILLTTPIPWEMANLAQRQTVMDVCNRQRYS